MESVWSEELEDKLVDLWQEHECLYQVTAGSYRDRVIGCRILRPVECGSQSIGDTKVYDFFPEGARLRNRRNITIAATRFFCFLFYLIFTDFTENKRQNTVHSNVYKHAACSVMRDVSCPTSIPLAAEL